MEQPIVYACYNKNIDERINSSSGGIFILMARNIINAGGIVYGVTMSEDCYSAEYTSVSDLKSLNKLLGSKYIQAKIGNTYNLVKADLQKGNIVLFTGTGCQINGLKLFLQKEYTNLICMDVVCHGVPSKKLWRRYIKYQEEIVDEKITKVNFRSKEAGWKDFGTKENERYIPKNEDEYMEFFLKNYSLRPSCYNCVAKKKKMSDFSLADFWGIEELEPEFNDGLGCSLIFIRSEKGKDAFRRIVRSINYKLVSYNDVVKFNTAEYHSVSRPIERDNFYKDLDTLSFYDLKKKYTDIGKTKFYKIMKKVIRKLKNIFFLGGRNK